MWLPTFSTQLAGPRALGVCPASPVSAPATAPATNSAPGTQVATQASALVAISPATEERIILVQQWVAVLHHIADRSATLHEPSIYLTESIAEMMAPFIAPATDL